MIEKDDTLSYKIRGAPIMTVSASQSAITSRIQTIKLLCNESLKPSPSLPPLTY